MKTLTFSTLALFASAALWATHLPSPNPVNGAFIVMCCAAGATLRALHQIEVSK